MDDSAYRMRAPTTDSPSQILGSERARRNGKPTVHRTLKAIRRSQGSLVIATRTSHAPVRQLNHAPLAGSRNNLELNDQLDEASRLKLCNRRGCVRSCR